MESNFCASCCEDTDRCHAVRGANNCSLTCFTLPEVLKQFSFSLAHPWNTPSMDTRSVKSFRMKPCGATCLHRAEIKSFLLPHPPIPCHMYLSEAHEQFCPPRYMYVGFYLPFESISLAPQSFLLLYLNFILLKTNKDQRWQLLHKKRKISSPLIPINNIRPNFQRDI